MKFLVGVLSFFAVSCVHSTVIPFQEKAEAPTPEESIEIYRVQRPYQEFTEIGLITFKTEFSDISRMYSRLREDAAKHGAHAIVDLKSKSETHMEEVTITECEPVEECTMGICDADGCDKQCTTTQKCEDRRETKPVTTYTVLGSMIRRKL